MVSWFQWHYELEVTGMSVRIVGDWSDMGNGVFKNSFNYSRTSGENWEFEKCCVDNQGRLPADGRQACLER